jgi:serine/threonine protein phosphatase 1
MTLYAIGDIHGHLDRLEAAHALIAADRAAHGSEAAPVVHLGDLVDRGPDSRGVVGHLADGVARGEPWIVLMGNHDRLFLRFLDDPDWKDPVLRAGLDWFDPALGGSATLRSYGVETQGRARATVHRDALAAVPPSHRAFLNGLGLWHRAGESLFVHAGIRPGIPVERQVEDDLVWIRAPFLEAVDDHGVLVVHGHTTISEATHYGNRLNIDSGAAYGGPLSAVAVEGRRAWLLTPEGRRPLEPIASS